MKAVIETGYMEELYEETEYERIQSAILQVSKEFKEQIFGEKTEIEEQ